MKKIMIVEGMSCKHCQAAVEKALSAVEGVTEANIIVNNLHIFLPLKMLVLIV